MTPFQFHALATALCQVLRSQSVIIGTLAVDHPTMPTLTDCARLASQAADVLHAADAWQATAVDPPRDLAAEMDRAFTNINREGIFRDHTCYRCHDGDHPDRCPFTSPRDCPTLRARND